MATTEMPPLVVVFAMGDVLREHLEHMTEEDRVMYWPREFVDCSPDAKRMAVILAELMEALRKKKYDKFLSILKADNDTALLKSNWQEEKQKLNRELQRDVVMTVGETESVITIRLDRYSDSKMTIRRAVLEHEHDQAPLEEAECRKLRTREVEELEPPYYPSQMFMADRIIDRIETILDHYHDGKTINDFTGFEFQIYTFNSLMLEQQTIKRLCEPKAECLPAEMFAESRASVVRKGKKLVKKYILSKDVDARHEELKEMAEKHPETLFLIVADEAHWGVTGADDRKDEDSANKSDSRHANEKLVNSWDHGKHPNVIVLLVSATPFNLLTDCTRLITDKFYARHKETGKIIMLEPSRGNRYFSGIEDVTTRVAPGSCRNLHHVKWSESFEDKLRRGVVAKVAQPRRDKLVWLCVEPSDQPGRFELCGTDDPEKADEFTLKGDPGKVIITTQNNSLTLGVLKSEGRSSQTGQMESGVYFMDAQTQSFYTEFKVDCRFGQDIFQLECEKFGNGEWFPVLFDGRRWKVGRAPPVRRISSLETTHPDYTFIIGSSRELEHDETNSTKEYLSLNYYYNTVRNGEQKRLLRTDEQFNTMCNKLMNSNSFVEDDILAAEYSFYILIAKDIQEMDSKIAQYRKRRGSERTIKETVQHYLQKLEKKHGDFLRQLEEQQTNFKHFRPILPAVFTAVVEYLRNEARIEFNKQLKARKRTNPNEWCLALLRLVVYGKLESEFEMKCLEVTSNYPQLSDVLAHESETFAIVKDLLSATDDGKGLHGHMKVIRISGHKEKKRGRQPGIETRTQAGNRLYATLCLARQAAAGSGSYLFEVLRDYGNYRFRDQMKDIDDPDESTSVERIRQVLQPKCCQHCDPKTFESCLCENYERNQPSLRCKHCSHLHKDIVEYKDLHRLPCILILDRKGRIGDTFPPSFNVMDLRLKYKTKPVYLSTVMQDIGRLCRYEVKNDSKDLPYALVGPSLHEILQGSQRDSGTFFGIVRLEGAKLDRHVSEVQGGIPNEGPGDQPRSTNARTSRFDEQLVKKHHNRLLLEAEPQVGKTGVYLNVISKMRKRILRNEEDAEEIVFEYDSEDETEHQQKEGKNLSFDAQDWQYPYWKEMTRSPCLQKRVGACKYDRVYGPYEYGRKPQALKSGNQAERRRGIPIPSTSENAFKAFSFRAHSSCVSCMRATPQKVSNITVAGQEVRISVPYSGRFGPVFDRLHLNADTSLDDSLPVNANTSSQVPRASLSGKPHRKKLSSWIFMPSYHRMIDGNLNLAHTMVDQQGNRVDFVQVVVVRAEEFRVYCEHWQSTHAILQLPSTLKLGNKEANAKEGGVGFARLFIQLFAEEYHLKHIFVLDDNIPLLYEVQKEQQAGKEVIVRKNGNIELVNTSMYNVLSRMESLTTDKDSSPKPAATFDPYDKHNAKEAVHLCNDAETGLCAQHNFTGPYSRYAVTGIMKSRPTIRKMVKPFKRTHVFSLVLLNIEALKQKEIRYKPWSVYEDCNLNNDCDEKGLWVCKYRKFIMTKNHLKTWMPRVYVWPSGESLERMGQKDAAGGWVDPLLQWLKSNAPPKRLDLIPVLRPEEEARVLGEQLTDLTAKIRQIPGGKHLCLVLQKLKQYPSVSACFVLQQFFLLMKSVGGFQKHSLFIPTDLCQEQRILSRENFQEKLVKPCFGEVDFEVITSHNIQEYKVPVVLLYVEGKCECFQVCMSSHS